MASRRVPVGRCGRGGMKKRRPWLGSSMTPLPQGRIPAMARNSFAPVKVLPVIRTCSPLPISMLMSWANTGPSYLTILRSRKAKTGRSKLFTWIQWSGLASSSSTLSNTFRRLKMRSTEARHSAIPPALLTGQERAQVMCWKAWADCIRVPRVIFPRM